MKSVTRPRRNRPHLVTEAQPPLSADIAARQRRYLIMMGIRIACFVATVALFAAGVGWLAAIPAVGAITIPYFAVVMANGGREPASTRGFQAYEPRLPVRYVPPPAAERSADRPQPEAPPRTSQRSQAFSQETGPEKQPGNG
ncbi:MAG TPA: DUF3099 domain-containing protein [Streptosporangiaceae bacterium]|nr:DUF3099 domain-containing protein [Streptosporangiaceae bacterium]